MNVIRSACSRFSGATVLCRNNPAAQSCTQLPSFSSCVFSWLSSEQSTFTSKSSGAVLPAWHYQQVRTVKRGTEYQPNNIKRKRTHGWIKRISTRGGIEVILRRMLKGRKSLSH